MSLPAELPPEPSAMASRRITLALWLTWTGLVAGILLSWPAWAGPRSFPRLPALSFWQSPGAPWEGVLILAVLGLLAAGIVRPAHRWLAGGWVLFLALVMQDQVRWQPWIFQYGLFFGLACAASSRKDARLLTAWQLLLIATWFWSGFHKLGPAWQNLHQAAFVDPLTSVWPAWLMHFLRWQGPAVPWIEMLTAVALVFPATRRWGVVAAVGGHAFILLLIGPWGTGTNPVILPWNLVTAFLIVLLFRDRAPLQWGGLFTPGFRIPATALLLLLTVTPLLGRIGWWDRYASFQLYSGTDRRLFLVLDGATSRKLPAGVIPWLRPSPADPSLSELRFVEWSLQELRLPVPAEERILLDLARRFCVSEAILNGRSFVYVDYAFLLKEKGWDTHPPQAIATMKTIPEFRKTPPRWSR